jgi:hypothetical protein
MSGFRPRHPRLWLVTLAVVAAAVVFVVAVEGPGCGGGDSGTSGTAAPVSDYPYPVQHLDEVPNAHSHLAQGATFDGYNSDPPTNGPHAPVPAAWGVSDVALPKEVPIHNMEHAGVVVWYNCNAGPQQLNAADCTKLRADLTAIVKGAVSNGKFVLMTPYPSMKNRIALTAWQFLDAFDTFDGARVQKFIDAFVCHTDSEHFCK